MKYLDEYQYGIYPYVPEHMEQDESKTAFENYQQEPQNTYGLPAAPPRPNTYGNMPAQQNIYDMPGTPETLPPDALDNWETPAPNPQNYYRSLRGREAEPQNPYGFRETPRYRQPGMQPRQFGMPADPYPYNYPQNLSLALELMQEALSGENEDKLFYAQLLEAAPTREDRDIISGIRNDEMKHFELFRKLYYEHTGQILPMPAPYENGSQMTYCQGLKQALLGEVAAVEKYRKILFAMQDRRHINIMTEIITDELRHADLYGLLFDMNACHAR